jgi:hypothetical protein
MSPIVESDPELLGNTVEFDPEVRETLLGKFRAADNTAELDPDM